MDSEVVLNHDTTRPADDYFGGGWCRYYTTSLSSLANINVHKFQGFNVTVQACFGASLQSPTVERAEQPKYPGWIPYDPKIPMDTHKEA